MIIENEEWQKVSMLSGGILITVTVFISGVWSMLCML